MIKPLKKPTHIVPREIETGTSRQAIKSKAKLRVGSNNSRDIGERSISAKALTSRRINQRSATENKATVHTKAEKLSVSVNLSSGSPKENKDFESKIRSALSQSALSKTKSPSSAAESSKSGKSDPAIVFCSHPAQDKFATEGSQIQASVEAILKCQVDEQKALYHIIKALIKGNSEKSEPGAIRESIKGTLNPQASAFRTALTPKDHLPPTVAKIQQHLSTPHPPPKRRFHPRAAFSPNIFEPQTSVQPEKPSPIQSLASKHVPTGLSPTPFKKSAHNHRPQGELPIPTVESDIRSSILENSNGHCIHESYRLGPLKYQRPQLIIPPDESGCGREALAIDPIWAQAILNNFVQKYPMTGASGPRLAVISQQQQNAEIQQMLEFIIMQKREMAAIAGEMLGSGRARRAKPL